MKKLLAFLLVLVISIGCLASCNFFKKGNDGEDTEAPITDAIALLKGMLDSKKSVTKSFTVPTKVSAKGTEFTVAWAVDNDKIVLADSEGSKLVTVPAINAADFTFKLTATITSPSGKTESREWSITVPVIVESAGDLAENTAYKLFLYQGNKGQRFYALNTLDSQVKYIDTTLDPKAAPDFYVEKVGEGYKFYTMNGDAKSYVEAYLTMADDGHWSKKLRFTEDTAAASVWYYEYAGDTNKEGTNAWFTQCDENNEWYVLGTYNNFTTFSISEESRMTATVTGTTQFPAAFREKAEAEAEAPDEEKEVVIPDVTGATKPTVGEKYNLVLNHGKSNKVYYATGAMDGYYFATSETAADGVNVYIEETTGGWYIKAIAAGATKYINIVASGTHINLQYDDAPVSVWTWVDDLKTVKTTVDGTEYMMGTGSTSTYKTYSPNKVSDNPFPVRFVVSANPDQTAPEGGEGGENTPGGNTPSTPATDIKVGTPYILSSKNQEGNVYISGGVSSGRLNGTTTKADAVSLYLEAGAASGQYYIYYLEGEAKQYIKANENKSAGIAIVTEKDDACLWTVDSAAKTIISVAFSTRGLATQTTGEKVYTTFSFYATSNFASDDYCVAWFEEVDSEGGTTPGTPDEGGETDTAKEVSITEALAAEDGTKVIVKGTVVEIKEAWSSYNNMSYYIEDENSNRLYIFRSNTQVELGDTVTVTGEVGSYNDAKQIAKGSTAVVDVAAGGEEGGTTPGTPDEGEGGTGGDTTPDPNQPVVGTAYNLGMVHAGLNKTLWADGNVQSQSANYRFTTVEGACAAISFYIENAEGGYYLYVMNGDAKVYVNIRANGNYVNNLYEETAQSVWVWDADLGTLKVTVDDTDYVMGTASDKTYNNFEAKKVTDNPYYGKFTAAGVDHTYTTLANKCDACGNITTHDCVDADSDYACDLCAGVVVPATAAFAKADAVAVGDMIIFVCESTGVEMSTIGIKKFGESAAYTGLPAGTVILEVVAGTVDGTVGFKTTDGKFLTWTSGNYLQLADAQSENTNWKVTFDADGNAVIANQSETGLSEGRVIQYNASSPRFSTYKSGQTLIQIYKQNAEA